MLPQILRKSGIDSYVFLRPGPRELELPRQYFWWESPDGSRVLAYRIPHEYCAPRGDIDEHVEKALAALPADGPALMVFYGVGNHGGGPTKANIESIQRLNDATNGVRGSRSARRARSSTPSSNRTTSPCTRASCSTTPSAATRRTPASSAGTGAPRTCSSARRSGRRSPTCSAVRRTRWRSSARPGSSCSSTSSTTRSRARRSSRRTRTAATSTGTRRRSPRTAFNRAVQTISRRIDIAQEPELRPVVVFNPHPWRLRADVELEYTWLPAGGVRMTDDDGDAVPGAGDPAAHDDEQLARQPRLPRRRAAARLPRLPRSTPARTRARAAREPTRPSRTSTALELDRATGWLARLVDKATGVDLAAGSGRTRWSSTTRPTRGATACSRTTVAGEFECTRRAARRARAGARDDPSREPLRRLDAASRTWCSAQARFVEVRATLDWRERLKLLKLRVPTTVQTDRATFEVPYGHLERPADGDEQPAQAWVDVSADARARGAERLEVRARRAGRRHRDHRRAQPGLRVAPPTRARRPDGRYEYLDQGRQDFVYRLVPHAGDWRDAGVVRIAAELNQPPFALIESYHPGELPRAVRSSATAAATWS